MSVAALAGAVAHAAATNAMVVSARIAEPRSGMAGEGRSMDVLLMARADEAARAGISIPSMRIMPMA
jgi:uncharacterized membrane protein